MDVVCDCLTSEQRDMLLALSRLNRKGQGFALQYTLGLESIYPAQVKAEVISLIDRLASQQQVSPQEELQRDPVRLQTGTAQLVQLRSDK